MTVERQPVVLRDTPELGLELRDDTEIRVDGSFRAPVNLTGLLGASYVATGDFNGDGKPDLVAFGLLGLQVLIGRGQWHPRVTG